MDALLLTAALVGALFGFIASAVPGFHVNALSVLFLATAPASGGVGVAFLVGAFAASPFGLALPATFLGGSSEEGALQSLPAHTLAREGRGAEAVALQAWGAMLGVLLALPLAAFAHPVLVASWPFLSSAMPVLLALVIVLLVATEPARFAVHKRRVVVPTGAPIGRLVRGSLSRGADGAMLIGRTRVTDPHELLAAEPDGAFVEARIETVRIHGRASRAAGMAAATGALALSGALGLAALPLGAASPFGLPGSPLLPLLAGLFAAPMLVEALRMRAPRTLARLRVPRHKTGELLRAAGPGAACSALLGIVPGVSASHAALLAPQAKSAEHVLARLAAINGGAVVFTLLAWHALGKARAGALVAAQALEAPAKWTLGFPASSILDEALLVVAAAGLACILTRALAAPAARATSRIAPARLALGGLGVLVAMVLATTGVLGLFEFVAASLVGIVIARMRVRRGLAMGVILVPAMVRLAGWA